MNVISYVNPDADGVVSSLAVAFSKRQSGVDCRAVYMGKLDKETIFILNACGLEPPCEILVIPDDGDIVLVDTHHLSQLPRGLDPARVVEIFDHHPGGDAQAFPKAHIQNESVGAVCTLLSEKFRIVGMVPVGLARAMAFAIASNTLAFTAPSTTVRDEKEFRWLSEIAPVSPEDINKMLLARSDFDDQSDAELIRSNAKVFVISGRRVLLVQIEGAGVERLFERSELTASLCDVQRAESAEFSALSLVDPILKKTIIVAMDEGSRALMGGALGIQFAGNQVKVQRVMLRKTDFVPQLQEYLGRKQT